MYCFNRMIFIFLLLSVSCAQQQLKNYRKLSSINNCTYSLKKLLPTLHRSKGIEFEGAIPSYLDYKYIAQFIESRIQDLYPNSKVNITESIIDDTPVFKVQFNNDGQLYVYTVEDDTSLIFGLDESVKSIEISSPILRNYQDIEKHLTIIEDLKKVGLKARPDEGAIHIHHDLDDDFSFEELYFIYSSFAKMQKSFREVFHYNDRRGFNKSEHLEYIAKNLRRLIDSGEELEISTEVIELVDNKGYIRASHQYGTLEFRFFNSTTSKEEQLLFVDFINKFMKSRNDQGLKDLFKSSKEVSIIDVSEAIGAEIHLKRDLLEKIKKRNEYYEDLADIQEGTNPFLDLRKNSPKKITADELLIYIKNSKNDLELNDYLENHIESIASSSIENWFKIIKEIKENEISSIAILKHIPYKHLTPQEIVEIHRQLLIGSHGAIFSTSLNFLKKNIPRDELYSTIENLYIPLLKQMNIELDFSLSFLFEEILKSDLEVPLKQSIVSLLQKNFKFGELTKSHLKTYKLFEVWPLDLTMLKSLTHEREGYNTFSHAPLFRKIIEISSRVPSYMDELLNGINSNFDNDEQINFMYYFIEFLKKDNLEEITPLIPFFEKSFGHLKSFDKLEDMVTILVKQHEEIFHGPKRNKRLLNNIFRKLVSLPKASRKKSLLKQIIRLTSRVEHLEYDYYLDIIMSEMKGDHTQGLINDFIHLLTSAQNMETFTDQKIDQYLNFIWGELDNINYFQLSPFQIKSLLDNLYKLDRHVIKKVKKWSLRRPHAKVFKVIKNRLEKI